MKLLSALGNLAKKVLPMEQKLHLTIMGNPHAWVSVNDELLYVKVADFFAIDKKYKLSKPNSALHNRPSDIHEIMYAFETGDIDHVANVINEIALRNKITLLNPLTADSSFLTMIGVLKELKLEMTVKSFVQSR